jgi:hypothetical protein
MLDFNWVSHSIQVELHAVPWHFTHSELWRSQTFQGYSVFYILHCCSLQVELHALVRTVDLLHRDVELHLRGRCEERGVKRGE